MGKNPELFETVGDDFNEVVETIFKKKPTKVRNRAFMQELFNRFESIRNEKEDIEYWFARDLQGLLGYKEWRNFQFEWGS